MYWACIEARVTCEEPDFHNGSGDAQPRVFSAAGTVTITPTQLGYLPEGIDWRMPQKTWRPTAAGALVRGSAWAREGLLPLR
jgi:hypothetical protein